MANLPNALEASPRVLREPPGDPRLDDREQRRLNARARLAKAGLLDCGSLYPDPRWLRAVENTSDWLCTALFLAVPAALLLVVVDLAQGKMIAYAVGACVGTAFLDGPLRILSQTLQAARDPGRALLATHANGPGGGDVASEAVMCIVALLFGLGLALGGIWCTAQLLVGLTETL